MNPPTRPEEQLVVHVYAPTEGPDALRAYTAVRELWRDCGPQFRMNAPIPGLALPDELPATLDELMTGHDPDPDDVALAARERRGTANQAVLRRQHDVLNLSLALVPSGSAARHTDESDWAELDRLWTTLVAHRSDALLGEARVHIALLRNLDGPIEATAERGRRLGAFLPGPPAPGGWEEHGVLFEYGPAARRAALWEPTLSGDDGRAHRRFVIAAEHTDDEELSAWLWSDSGVAMPPFAQYLAQAAKLRYEVRVWQRGRDGRLLRAAIDRHAAELQPTVQRTGRLSSEDGDSLRRLATDAVAYRADVRQLRQTVEIALSNMELVLRRSGTVAVGGPFADDRAVASWLSADLADVEAYLEASADRADRLVTHTELEPRAGRTVSTAHIGRRARSAAPGSRNVFVVYGRDLQVRDHMFDFLRALDLQPLEWEELVTAMNSRAPFLGDVVARGIERARAALVLLTPDDVSGLHPDLRDRKDNPAELGPMLLPRPNVLIELGMALALYPERTVIVRAGNTGVISDLNGRNYIQLNDSAACRSKIATRLSDAECAVNPRNQDWLSKERFTNLRAYTRSVS